MEGEIGDEMTEEMEGEMTEEMEAEMEEETRDEMVEKKEEEMREEIAREGIGLEKEVVMKVGPGEMRTGETRSPQRSLRRMIHSKLADR